MLGVRVMMAGIMMINGVYSAVAMLVACVRKRRGMVMVLMLGKMAVDRCVRRVDDVAMQERCRQPLSGQP